jgi:hypothetical protein
MAGRLGVLRKLVGVGGSLLVMLFDGARAESRRCSSSPRCVRRSAEALGPGLVRGRRELPLLSHPRTVGVGGSGGGGGFVVALDVADVCRFSAEVVSAVSDTSTASSLMTGWRRNLPSSS